MVILQSDKSWQGKEEKTMEAKTGDYSGLWKGFMVGSFLGAAAGFLFAPKSGKELRSEIKEETNKALDETKRFYSDSRTKFRDTLGNVSGRREKASASTIESPEELVADA
jgi:gas vesicle protein